MDIHPSARIEPTAYVDRTWPRGVHIGADCFLAEESVVLTHDQTRGLFLDTVIGARCYVGHRAIVMPGVTVGEDSILMAGAVVTKNMPSHSVAVGNPATFQARDDS